MITPSPTANVQDVTANPWIEWNGGERPVEEYCVVQFRNRARPDVASSHRFAGALDWRHDPLYANLDITSYRVVSA